MTVRRKRGNIFLWLILAIMVVAMAGLGLNSAIQSSRSSTVFRVGDSEVTQGEYYNALQARIADISQQQGQPLSMNEAKLMGVTDQVKARLINQATLSEIARRNNIRASDEAVARELVSIEAFQDAAGNFNRQNLDLYLRNRGITEDDFLDSIKTNLERDMVLNTLAGEPIKIDHLTGVIANQVGEKRVVSYVKLDAVTDEEIEAPTEEEIRALYDEDPTRFLGEPARSFEIAYALPDLDAVTEGEVQAYYDENGTDFGAPAQVTYEVLAFPDEEQAKAFYDSPDFEALAVERGLDAKDYLFEDQTLDGLPEELRSQIEAKGKGIYPPVKALLGWNVYQVNDYTAAELKPLAEVEVQIREIIAGEALNTKLSEDYSNISQLVSEGASPETLGESTSLDYVEWNNSQDAIAGLTDQTEFKNEAEQAQVGEERELVKLPKGGVFVIRLKSENDAVPMPFDEVHDEIAEELKTERKNEAQDATAQGLLGELETASLEEIAEANGLEVTTTEPANSQESFTQMPLAISFEAFQRDKGESWVARDQNDRYIAHVDEVIAFDPSTTDGSTIQRAVADQVNGATTEGMVVQFLNQAAKEYGAVEYDALVRQVEGQIN